MNEYKHDGWLEVFRSYVPPVRAALLLAAVSLSSIDFCFLLVMGSRCGFGKYGIVAVMVL